MVNEKVALLLKVIKNQIETKVYLIPQIHFNIEIASVEKSKLN